MRSYLDANDSGGRMVGGVLDLADDEARENIVFVSRLDTTRNYWFSGGHSRMTIRGNVSALPAAFEAMKQVADRQSK